MFVTEAYAQGAGGTGDIFTMLLPLVLIMAVFWFLLIRPQQKRVKEHQELIRNIRRGDVVTTSGGIIGKVSRVVDDNEVLLEVAENVRMRLQKPSITEVRSKGEPIPAAEEGAEQPKKRAPARKKAARKSAGAEETPPRQER